MSNCKAFGHLRARNHAIGQTPRGVLAPRFQNEFQGSAAFSIIEKATSARHRSDADKTPERRQQGTGATPARHRSDADMTVAVRPSPPDDSDQVRPTTSTKSARRVEPESTPSNRNTPCPITVLSRRSRHSRSRHSQSRHSRSQHTGLAADDFVHRRPQHNHQKAPRIYRHSK